MIKKKIDGVNGKLALAVEDPINQGKLDALRKRQRKCRSPRDQRRLRQPRVHEAHIRSHIDERLQQPKTVVVLDIASTFGAVVGDNLDVDGKGRGVNRKRLIIDRDYAFGSRDDKVHI